MRVIWVTRQTNWCRCKWRWISITKKLMLVYRELFWRSGAGANKQIPYSDLLVLTGDSKFDCFNISVCVELTIGPKIQSLKWIHFLKSEAPGANDTRSIVESHLGAKNSKMDLSVKLNMVEMFGGSVLHIILSKLIKLLLTINLYKS